MMTMSDQDQAPALEMTDEPVPTEPMSAAKFIEHQKHHLLSERATMRTPDIQRNGHHIWKRAAVTLKQQNDYPGKVFLFERLEWDAWEPASAGDQPIVPGMEKGMTQYRIGYFVVSPIRNKWWWGQSAPFIPADDLRELLALAKEEGTLAPGDVT
jgi:hypothetical protein